MLRVRYRPNELGETGLVEMLPGDSFKILDDHTVKILTYDEEDEKYRITGFIHPNRWESIVQVEDATIDGDDF